MIRRSGRNTDPEAHKERKGICMAAETTKKPITTDMIIGDILANYPDAAELLMMCGMGCISCPASQMESLADACMVHGIDADEVTKYLNVELELLEA